MHRSMASRVNRQAIFSEPVGEPLKRTLRAIGMDNEILVYLSTIEVEDHFHRLLESKRELLETLSSRFSLEPDCVRRQALVRLAWQRGGPGTSKSAELIRSVGER